MSASERLTVPVLIGSVRSDRQGIKAAHMVIRALVRRGHEPVPVDPVDLRLPLLDRTYKEHPQGQAQEPLERLATLYRGADGFVVVSGEYNHGIPPALKNLLDYFLEEYFWRPSAIVSYSSGGFGGVRAAMQLRMVLAELGMPSIPTVMSVPCIREALDEAGVASDEHMNRALGRFLDEFEWYARALRRERAAGMPY